MTVRVESNESRSPSLAAVSELDPSLLNLSHSLNLQQHVERDPELHKLALQLDALASKLKEAQKREIR